MTAFCPNWSRPLKRSRFGDGLVDGTKMGPLCHTGRVTAMEKLVDDARENGGAVLTGGARIGNSGCFYASTIVTSADDSIALMREEPFGPVAVVSPFRTIEMAWHVQTVCLSDWRPMSSPTHS